METRWSFSVRRCILLTGLTLCAVLVTKPVCAIEIYTDPEVVIQNGTTGTLRCTFKSTEVVSSYATVTWSFQSNQPGHQASTNAYVIYHFSNGKGFFGQEEFKDRVVFIGDLNKRDVSIKLGPAQFTDNGTFFCDVKNPPDVKGTPARTELRVVVKGESDLEALPSSNAGLITGVVVGVLALFIIIAIAACFAMKAIHNRNEYEGRTSVESGGSPVPPPQKKAEPGRESARRTGQSGPVQGPVIYVQLDHTGSKNSFHKMEPVVYADIRKN